MESTTEGALGPSKQCSDPKCRGGYWIFGAGVGPLNLDCTCGQPKHHYVGDGCPPGDQDHANRPAPV
jgi:hypothetical protein